MYFTPGPSQVHSNYEKDMKKAIKLHIPSISHRSKLFMEIMKGVEGGLRKLLSIPLSHHIFCISSSLESMERILSNVVKKKSFHFVSGSFGEAFAAASAAQGLKCDVHHLLPGERIPTDTFFLPSDTELICITQNETANGSCVPLEDIYRLKEKYPNIPVAVDIVSSAPYPDLDFTKIDCTFFSVQKGFGLPSGLSILIVCDKLVRTSTKKGYHDFPSLLSKSLKNQTPETPNVLNIFLLGEVLKAMNEKGIRKIRKETEEKAQMIETLGNLSVTDPTTRSKTVLVINTFGKTKEMKEKLEKKGIIIGSGYGDKKKIQVRIANFPQHSIDDVKRLLLYCRKYFAKRAH